MNSGQGLAADNFEVVLMEEAEHRNLKPKAFIAVDMKN